MPKKLLPQKDYIFLKYELEYAQEKGAINDQGVKNILGLYEVKQGLNFVQIVLTIGALLVGLGILSFIASNWAEINKITKLSIIIGVFLGSNFAAFKLSGKYPKTGTSLVYLGVLTYGAGIFLIGQMFNYGGHFSGAFLLWALGIIPMAALLKDKIIFIFLHLLSLVYLNGNFSIDGWPFIMFLIVGVLYYLNKIFDYFKLGTFFNNLIFLNTIGYFATRSEIEDTYIYFLFLFIGLVMYFKPLKLNTDIFRIQGNILVGIFGLILTFRGSWDILPLEKQVLVSVIFAIFYLLFMLLLTRKGNVLALIFVCITIFRYYFDNFYDFMPKSLFFIIGGLLLLGFGYYFERLRKRGALHVS